MAAAEVEGIAHRYGDRIALEGVSFALEAGQSLALLGPNGGGKTTLLHVLATLLVPTRGRARIDGVDVVAEPTRARWRIGVVFQRPSLDPRLTAAENLRHHGHLYGLGGRELADRARDLLDRLGVADRADERVARLSGGLQRRVEIAKGLLHEPSVLLLDEPTVGLDPAVRRAFWALVDELAAERRVAVLVATHLLDEAEPCDRVGILDRGRLVALAPPAELEARIRGDVIVLESDDPGRLAAAIDERFGEPATVVDGVVRMERPDGAAFVPRVTEAFPGLVQAIRVGRPTLDDVFIELTGHRLDDPDGETA